ncbi:MAG: lipoprotein-releasing ABC transporter permease subunit [bacterium]
MINNLPVFIALRYIRGRTGNGFVSFVSLLSFFAMTVGVAVLIVVMSVMNGFNGEIRNRILSVIPHGVVAGDGGFQDWHFIADAIADNSGVAGSAPIISGFGMLSGNGVNKGVAVEGIDPNLESAVTPIREFILQGDTAYLREGEFGMLLGDALARSLNVRIGDSLMLSLPELTVTPAGTFPRFKRFRVVGIFRVGAQVDDGLAFIHIGDARRIYRKPPEWVGGMRIKFDDPLKASIRAASVRQNLPEGVQLLTWEQQMGDLFSAIRMEKLVVGVILCSIIAVAAFNIIASLVLMVADRRREIAVLKTLGASQRMIVQTIMCQGSILGISGVLLGALLGGLLAINISGIVAFFERVTGSYVFDPSIYFIDALPSELQLGDILVIAMVGIVLSVLATLYPARSAGLIPPAEALRYDQ